MSRDAQTRSSATCPAAGVPRFFLATALCALLVTALAPTALMAQAAEKSPQIEPPTTGFRAEYLDDMAVLRRKIIGLAEAMPESVYDWAPAEGIRTTGQVYMHLAQTNVNILQGMGRSVPADLRGDLEQKTNREDVIATLKASFRHLRTSVLETTDADLEGQVEFFGRTWSRRALFYLAATHTHEHLGQAIAYARSNEVVPPWSAPAQTGSLEEPAPPAPSDTETRAERRLRRRDADTVG